MSTKQFKFPLLCLMLPKLTSSHIHLHYDIISSALSVLLFPKDAAQSFSATLPPGLGGFNSQKCIMAQSAAVANSSLFEVHSYKCLLMISVLIYSLFSN